MRKIIIDFDHTLFNAQLFKKDLAKALSMKELYKNSDYKKQIAKFPIKNQQKFLRVLKNAKKYLYKDSLNFLKKNDNIILLSKGQQNFQKIKIKNCNLEKYLKIIIVEKSKISFFDKIKNKSDIIFINDRGMEIDEIKKKFPEITAIWIRRPNGHYKNEPCKKYDFKINNLKDKKIWGYFLKIN